MISKIVIIICCLWSERNCIFNWTNFWRKRHLKLFHSKSAFKRTSLHDDLTTKTTTLHDVSNEVYPFIDKTNGVARLRFVVDIDSKPFSISCASNRLFLFKWNFPNFEHSEWKSRQRRSSGMWFFRCFSSY